MVGWLVETDRWPSHIAHHATVAVPTGLMTPEDGGRSKEAGESGSRFIPNLPYLISDLPEIHMHALPTAISKGVTLRHSVGLAWRPRGRDPTPDDWISRPDGRPASSNLSVRNCRVGLGQMTSRRTGESPTAAPRPRPSPPSVHRQAPGGPHTGTRHRVGTGGRRHRHRERPTRVPATRAAADPNPHRSLSNRASSTRPSAHR